MFVLLEHTTPQGKHWDLLIEQPGRERLRSWRLAANPVDASGEILAERMADHRPIYLEFEGDIGGGRGVVRRVDRGPAEWLSDEPRRVRLSLRGEQLVGTFEAPAGESFSGILRRC